MGLNKGMLKKGIEQDSHTAHAVHPKAETSLAGEERFHVVNSYGRTEQMISIGARNDTGQLFARKTAVKRKK